LTQEDDDDDDDDDGSIDPHGFCPDAFHFSLRSLVISVAKQPR
jgi:hypothetical protein